MFFLRFLGFVYFIIVNFGAEGKCFMKKFLISREKERDAEKQALLHPFVDSKGNVLGLHAGIIHYTVGQRKGLGIAFGEPRYVIRLDVPKNQVVLGTLDELMTKEVLFDDINYMSVSDINEPVKVTGKVRYSAKDVPCTLYPAKDGIMKAVFEEPVRAATPGQAAVFYKDGCIVCGGSII